MHVVLCCRQRGWHVLKLLRHGSSSSVGVGGLEWTKLGACYAGPQAVQGASAVAAGAGPYGGNGGDAMKMGQYTQWGG